MLEIQQEYVEYSEYMKGNRFVYMQRKEYKEHLFGGGAFFGELALFPRVPRALDSDPTFRWGVDRGVSDHFGSSLPIPKEAEVSSALTRRSSSSSPSAQLIGYDFALEYVVVSPPPPTVAQDI